MHCCGCDSPRWDHHYLNYNHFNHHHLNNDKYNFNHHHLNNNNYNFNHHHLNNNNNNNSQKKGNSACKHWQAPVPLHLSDRTQPLMSRCTGMCRAQCLHGVTQPSRTRFFRRPAHRLHRRRFSHPSPCLQLPPDPTAQLLRPCLSRPVPQRETSFPHWKLKPLVVSWTALLL